MKEDPKLPMGYDYRVFWLEIRHHGCEWRMCKGVPFYENWTVIAKALEDIVQRGKSRRSFVGVHYRICSKIHTCHKEVEV